MPKQEQLLHFLTFNDFLSLNQSSKLKKKIFSASIEQLLLSRLTQHFRNCSFWHLVTNSYRFSDLENLDYNRGLSIALKALFLVANTRFVFVQDCTEDFYLFLFHLYLLIDYTAY